MSKSESAKHVVIIGAGPAGLAAAVCLARRGVAYTLLEQGSLVSSALRQVDPDMVLLSPTGLSLMPGMERRPGDPEYLPFRELVAALEHYQEKYRVQVVNDAQVTSVDRDGEAFTVRYRGKDEAEHVLKGSHVVNATGIISRPQLPPDFKPGECSFSWMHSLKARGSDLAAARTLLVVGGGASAAEVLERWLEVRHGEAHAWLSLRSPMMAFPHWILGIDVHYFTWLPEQLPAGLFGWRAGRLHEPMTGLKVSRAIRRGLITRAPAVKGYQGDAVTFKDGRQIRPDLVVFSTGFRYASEHFGGLVDYDPDGRPLVKNCESTRTRGLYLLGFRFGRTFASPYLRGIARDARYVAERIASEGG
ncbi:MAG TPA: NAD(P)-binding domain-containing protein [Pyrinomonadaceae bacterium]|jgi:cation diffusion facilitator CzcD-associated flavoprotein CzcO